MGPWPLIVLAAGASRRFGSDKRFASLADGRSLLERTLAECSRLSAKRYLVLESEREDTQSLALRYGYIPVIAERARNGMGASLAAGVAALPANSTGCWVCPVDLPALDVSALRPLFERLFVAEAGSDASIEALAPSYEGRRGHPAWISAQHFGFLQTLNGDEGAKRLWQAGGGGLCETVDHAGVVLDADTAEQLAAIKDSQM